MSTTEETKILGVFWGTKNLYFAETIGKTPLQIFHLPFPEATEASQTAAPVSLPIKDAFQFHNITTDTINLSLPTKEIIFRSFVIPWMQPNELKEAVQFEARKYVPFDLSELLYSYHSFTIMENNERHLRIIFVAIKKEALENYTNIFDLANIRTTIIEPAPLSLIRALMLKEKINDTDTLAIVEKDDLSGKIIIVDKGVPQFVREFQFHTAATGEEAPDENAITLRLINEIRISLDYFNRQENTIEVNQTIVLTNKQEDYLINTLKEELGHPVTGVTSSQIVELESATELGYVHALGVALDEKIDLPADFFLLKKKEEKPKRKASTPQTSSLNIKSMIMTAAICLPLMLFVFLGTRGMANGPKKQIASLKQQLGPYESASADKLNEKSSQLKAKVDQFNTIRITSDVNLFLELVPSLLPEGAWLGTFDIVYADSQSQNRRSRRPPTPILNESGTTPTLVLEGYIYLEDTKEQIRLVNQFLRNLKRDKDFTEYFKNINLESSKIEKLNEFTVTAFRIICN